MKTIILGAGPIGLATAYELAKQGVEVTVISPTRPTTEAGHVNAGWIVPIMCAPVPAPGALKKTITWLTDSQSPLKIAPELNWGHISFMISMLRYSTKKEFLHGFAALSEFGRGTLNSFDEYIQEGVNFEIHRTGVLMAFSSQAELDSHAIEFEDVEKYGLSPVKTLTGDQMRSREPLLSSFVDQGIDCHDQYFVDPSSFIQGLRVRCEKMGVVFVETDSNINLNTAGSKAVVLLGDKKIDAENIVIAAGAQSRLLLAQIKVNVPVRFGKGYCFDFSGEKRIKNALYLSGAKIAVTPNNDYLRFAGTMEFGGSESKINLKRAQGILKNSSQYFTEDVTQNVAPKVGLRPMTPDGLPVIGKVGDFSNLYIASGHAMQGVTLAPNTGKVVANLLLNKESKIDITDFSPNRFN